MVTLKINYSLNSTLRSFKYGIISISCFFLLKNSYYSFIAFGIHGFSDIDADQKQNTKTEITRLPTMEWEKY